ncbi:energy transducer TonB [Pseudomonas sp. WS 5018]|uniref:Protein TonB n=1 Tax=Stutzerimonas stutzeri TaxID=316 RepID=A0A4S2BK43_STUST|nr:energy transducer TonB [Stutzerimonas stutzeri]NMY62589.1 energy transducer TonB [Pseudomonas sp. WS 5018]AEA83871.1 TonB domain-containing protein [Stutzerimonas stutzeri DSM 4166]MDH0145878.1 energy transducer TonB [Stutzerimonas stutzeri]MDH0150465.1 energy transducer TonB [Stutzerimonas stutzeri]MDH0153890.1 energy transducer TonB [Stutzerimonas stutzeri]
MALGLSAPPAAVLKQRRWTGAAGAALTTLGLHAGLFVLLLTSWTPTMDAPVATQVMQTQLISLPPPVPVLPEPPVAKPVEAPPPPVQVEAPPQVEQADLAFKRAEREREAEQQLERRRQEQRRRDEQQRREQERLAEQARLDAQRRQAEATARAEAAERARQAAAAEAASRQYLPIAKKPPVYPQRALDAGLQGACTVSYTVDVQGRVRSPKVVGDCHPLFIRPSLIAAQSFRYQPRIVDGRAVEVPNVQNTFHYRIE